MITPEDRNEIQQMIDARLSGLSMEGHAHDGDGEHRILMSQLERDPDAYGIFPFKYKYADDVTSQTLSTSDSNIASATVSVKKTSNILVLARCEVDNDAATHREITFKIKRGSTTLYTTIDQIPSNASDKITTTFFTLDSPQTRGDLTYHVSAATDAGSPTAEDAAIMAIEMPHRLSSTS